MRDPIPAPAFRESLLGWYAGARRPLPWRTQPSLYRTVVSEFMCQQTQVATVLPYFAEWMEQFPDFASLAAAEEATVLRAWEGLGYYSRARNLHRLAKAVAAMDAPPATAAEWRALPGIGPYTAAAIASIVFGEAVPVIDGNVIRVLARLTADATPFPTAQKAQRHFERLARDLLDAHAPGEYNQAMMELGATVCVKHRPACLLCPVRTHCLAGQSGRAADFPVVPRRAQEKVEQVRLWIEEDGALLLARGGANGRLQSLYELPLRETLPQAVVGELLFSGKRAITHHLYTEHIHRAKAPAELTENPALSWVPHEELESIPLSGPHRRWVRALLKETADGRAERDPFPS
ncbi:MAG: A/G-specific adenine glycosylase [Opitutales bacterium]|nr:A/G-specific adenine glycosylase [Opitutales bacterium]